MPQGGCVIPSEVFFLPTMALYHSCLLQIPYAWLSLRQGVSGGREQAILSTKDSFNKRILNASYLFHQDSSQTFQTLKLTMKLKVIQNFTLEAFTSWQVGHCGV